MPDFRFPRARFFGLLRFALDFQRLHFRHSAPMTVGPAETSRRESPAERNSGLDHQQRHTREKDPGWRLEVFGSIAEKVVKLVQCPPTPSAVCEGSWRCLRLKLKVWQHIFRTFDELSSLDDCMAAQKQITKCFHRTRRLQLSRSFQLEHHSALW